MGSLKKYWELFVINTLDNIQEIETVVEGLVVGILGIILGLGGFYFFGFLGLELSAQICLLSIYAYAAVCFYHLFAYEREKDRLGGKIGRVLEGGAELIALLIVVMILYVFILDQVLAVRAIANTIKMQKNVINLAVRGFPGLVVLATPLFGWKKFAELTPTDNILRKVFKK